MVAQLHGFARSQVARSMLASGQIGDVPATALIGRSDTDGLGFTTLDRWPFAAPMGGVDWLRAASDRSSIHWPNRCFDRPGAAPFGWAASDRIRPSWRLRAQRIVPPARADVVGCSESMCGRSTLTLVSSRHRRTVRSARSMVWQASRSRAPAACASSSNPRIIWRCSGEVIVSRPKTALGTFSAPAMRPSRPALRPCIEYRHSRRRSASSNHAAPRSACAPGYRCGPQ